RKLTTSSRVPLTKVVCSGVPLNVTDEAGVKLGPDTVSVRCRRLAGAEAGLSAVIEGGRGVESDGAATARVAGARVLRRPFGWVAVPCPVSEPGRAKTCPSATPAPLPGVAATVCTGLPSPQSTV